MLTLWGYKGQSHATQIFPAPSVATGIKIFPVCEGLIYHALILTLLLDAYLFECGSKQYIAKPS